MSMLGMFFRCVGEAVCAKGLKALMTLVPFGEAAYEIAEETYRRVRLSMRAEQQLAAIGAAAQATVEEARREAKEAVQEIAAQQHLSPEAQINLVSYLEQIPPTVRQTMKRPSDPSGKTVPSSFTLQKPEQLVTMLPARLPSLKPGDRPPGVGNWVLVELLGAGGFGEVWLARHPSLHGVTAALKFCLDTQAAESLKHEAHLLDRVMQQGRHPGIVALRQAYLEATPLCLEYEYVNGGDLSALLAEWRRGGKIPIRPVNTLMLRLSEIVAHAHTLSPPIVHRDLKPANILVERTAGASIRLRVTDFGIGGLAATTSLQGTKRGTVGQKQAMSTSLRGAHTPLYASPQQMRGDDPDPRDDVHALGVIWYQLLTGDLTAGVPTDWMTVLQDAGQERPLIDLLGRCVTSRLEKRLANAGELAQLLEEILNPKPVLVPEVVEEIPTAEEVIEVEEVVPVAEYVPEPAPKTRRKTPEQTTRRGDSPKTQRGSTEQSRDPTPTPAKPTPPGHQVRRFPAPGVKFADLVRDLTEWLRGEGFRTQQMKTEDGGTLIQIEQEGAWRSFVGMSTALNIVLRQEGDEINVEIGEGKWLDKAAAAGVSLFVLWPLAVTAAIGAWQQMKMPERIFARVGEVVTARKSSASGRLSADDITRLRELAELRDQGVLSDDEFQEEKARMLRRS